jgi:hypothetical protein
MFKRMHQVYLCSNPCFRSKHAVNLVPFRLESSSSATLIMVRAEEEDDTMRPCGCHAGRPCTCEMGGQAATSTTFVCGLCVNCRLNVREGTRARKRSSGPRRCLKSAEYLAELAFDKVILRGNCVFRMRKPNWKSVCCTLAHSNARSVLTPFALPAV